MKTSPDTYAHHYASLSEDDLQRLTLDVKSLVPEARVALRREMERRHLQADRIDWTAQPISNVDTVGGWLLFYCVSAVIVLPLWLVVALPQYPLWVALLFLPPSVLYVGSGLLLWRRNPNGLRWVRWSLLYLFAVALMLLLLALVSVNSQVIPGLVVGSIPSILWWKYFRKSQRVHAIFGHNMQALRWPRNRQDRPALNSATTRDT